MKDMKLTIEIRAIFVRKDLLGGITLKDLLKLLKQQGQVEEFDAITNWLSFP